MITISDKHYFKHEFNIGLTNKCVHDKLNHEFNNRVITNK